MFISQLLGNEHLTAVQLSIKKISRKVHVTCGRKIKYGFESLSKNGSVYSKESKDYCRLQIPPSHSCNHIHTKKALGPFKSKKDL